MTNPYSIGSKTWPGLSKLMEEMGELQQVLGKLIGSNGDVNHWSGDLNEKLIEEMGDVYASLDFFRMENNIPLEAIKDRHKVKLNQYNIWHRL